jgi:hypothetical protein
MYAQMDVEMKRKAKYLLLWLEAIQNKKSAAVVSNILSVNKMSRIVLCWRYLVEKN